MVPTPGQQRFGMGDVTPWIGPVSSVVGSLIDANSQKQTNKANAQQIKDQQAFQAQQSSTQYQRGVADMTAAGLNPGLAYQQGGNAASSGAAAHMDAPYKGTAEKFAEGVASYNAIATATAQRDLIRAQTDATQKQATYTGSQNAALQPTAILGQSGSYIQEYINQKIAEARGGRFTAEKVPEMFRANLNNLTQSTETAKATAANLRSLTSVNDQLLQRHALDAFLGEGFEKYIAPHITGTADRLQKLIGKTRN